jgi:two-component system, response regulator PdtaR
MNKHTFNILIVEDEGIVANDLAARLSHSGYNIIGIADNYEDALNLFTQHQPDLVLLDITIKGTKTGIDVATAINNLLPTPFIFITAHVDATTLESAKNTFPSAYLVKPFTTNHLLVSVELAIHNFAYQKKGIDAATSLQADEEGEVYRKQEYVFIKDNYSFVKLHQQDITYLEAQDNYVRINTAQKHYMVRCTLAKAMERLNNSFIIRVHRSFCVNINCVDKFNEQEIQIGNATIPIGRNYKTDFVEQFEIR